MKRTPLLSLLLGLALFATACAGAVSETTSGDATPGADTPTTAPVVDANPAPTTEFVMFDGSTATFADYAGQPLVVNFWASWCPSCIAEMSAALKPAQEQLGEQVAFLGLNLQDERDKALELVEETGVLFDLGEDAVGDLYIELGGIGMPFTVFIDANGNVVEKHNGPLSEQQLVDLIQEKLLP